MKTILSAILLAVSLSVSAQTIIIFNQNNLSNDMVYKMVSANLQNSDSAGLRLYTVNTNSLVIDDQELLYGDGAYKYPEDESYLVTNKNGIWCYYAGIDPTGNPTASNALLNTTMEWSPEGSGIYSRFYVTLNADNLNSFVWGGKILQPVTAALQLNYATNNTDGVENVAAVEAINTDGDSGPIVLFKKTNAEPAAVFNGTSGMFTIGNHGFQTNAEAVTPNVTLWITNQGVPISFEGHAHY